MVGTIDTVYAGFEVATMETPEERASFMNSKGAADLLAAPCRLATAQALVLSSSCSSSWAASSISLWRHSAAR